MASVVLQNGEDSYCCSWELLKQFPDSLLANYAQLLDHEPSEPYAAADGATTTSQGEDIEGNAADRTCGAVVIPVQQLPRSPLTDWPQAPAMAHSLYSHHCITLDLLRPMLAGITGRTPPHFVAPYEQLSELIAYLNLPGAVSRCLPDFSTVSLHDGSLLSFACNVRALEAQHDLPAAAAVRSIVHNTASNQRSDSTELEPHTSDVKAAAEAAARLMLSYKPYPTAAAADAGSSQPNVYRPSPSSSINPSDYHRIKRCALFAVILDSKVKDGSLGWTAPLRVYVLNRPTIPHYSQSRQDSSGLRFAEITAGCEPGDFKNRLESMPLDSLVGTPNRYSRSGFNRSVAAGLLWLEGHIWSAFSSLAANTSLKLTEVTASYTATTTVYDEDRWTTALGDSIMIVAKPDSMPWCTPGYTLAEVIRYVPLWAVEW